MPRLLLPMEDPHDHAPLERIFVREFDAIFHRKDRKPGCHAAAAVRAGVLLARKMGNVTVHDRLGGRSSGPAMTFDAGGGCGTAGICLSQIARSRGRERNVVPTEPTEPPFQHERAFDTVARVFAADGRR